MGKQKIVPGATLDIPTSDELAAVVRAEFRHEVRERVRAQAGAKTDANGAVTVSPYTVDTGMEFRLTRVLVEADGYSYAAMFTNAAGAVTIQRGGQVLDGYNLATGIPNAWTGGSADAPRYRNGEKVDVVVVGGPANTNVNVRIEGDLYPYRIHPSA